MQATFRRGCFRGRAIDTRTRRSIVIVAEDDQSFTLDHFFHAGRFHRAVVPKNAVIRIHGQRFNFGGGRWPANAIVNHAQARFVLDPERPIRLHPLPGDPTADSSVIELTDFVYSVEVAGPRGVSWSLRHAFGDFVSAHRVLSTEEVVFERVVLGGYRVSQSPPLCLSHAEMQRGLELLLRRSDRVGMRQPYYLLTLRMGATNCTSAVFTALDEILAERYSWPQRVVSKLLWRLPINLRRYLRLRSAIDSGVSMPPLNVEFARLAASAELRDRLQSIGS